MAIPCGKRSRNWRPAKVNIYMCLVGWRCHIWRSILSHCAGSNDCLLWYGGLKRIRGALCLCFHILPRTDRNEKPPNDLWQSDYPPNPTLHGCRVKVENLSGFYWRTWNRVWCTAMILYHSGINIPPRKMLDAYYAIRSLNFETTFVQKDLTLICGRKRYIDMIDFVFKAV